jgi:hypothetical protein
MYDFLDTASRLLSVGEVNEKKAHFERVFKAISLLQAVHSKSQLDLNNIESIFTALEIANVLGKLPGFNKEEIPEVITSLKEVIVTTLEKSIYFPTHGRTILPTSTYNKFAELISYLKNDSYPELSSSVITFNYDIALDVAMHRNGQGPVYGFGPSVQASLPTNLLKLHGSLNWAVKTEDGSVQPLTLQEYFSKYSYQGFGEETSTCHIPIGSQLQEYYSKHTLVTVNPEPVIVPPTWNKADYHHLLSTIWGVAARELEDAEYIFIIGYSLPETDAFFRLLYGLGTVGNTPLKKVAVFNPDTSGEVESRFRNMLGPGALARFEFRPLAFNDSVNNIRSMFPKRK